MAFPWQKDMSIVRTAFRGNEYSAEGIEHRARQNRMQQEQTNQLKEYANKSKLASCAEESKRRMRNVRDRNSLFQKAGQASMEKDALQHNEYERRLRNLELDRALASEVSKRVSDERSRERIIQRICEEDPTLRELQAKLKAAYMNQERASQLSEKRTIAKSDLRRDALLSKKIEVARREAQAKQFAADEERRLNQLSGANAITEQMLYKQNQQREEAYREYLKDRTEIEKLVGDIQKEQHQEVALMEKKREDLRHDMLMCLDNRKTQIKDRKREEQDAEDRINAYKKQVFKRGEKEAERKAALDAEQTRIRMKLEADAEAKRREEDRVHDALELLRKEEADRRRSDAEAARRNRLERMKREMMEANEAQKRFKKAQGVRDMEAEKVLVSKMMAKFKEDERKLKGEESERLRQRDLYKMGMEKQMLQRQEMYHDARAVDERERRDAGEKEEFRRRVVEEARKRLIREHASQLKQFLPKGVLQSEDDLELLAGASGARVDERTLTRYGDTYGDALSEEQDRERAFARLRSEQAEVKRKLREQHAKKSAW